MNGQEPEPPEEPLILKEHSRGESRALNISLRGWMALIIVVTFCWVAAHAADPVTVMKDVVFMVLTFYYATRSQSPKP